MDLDDTPAARYLPSIAACGRTPARSSYTMADHARKARPPRTSDYRVHDQDGRPLLLVNRRRHESIRPCRPPSRPRSPTVLDGASAFPSEWAEQQNIVELHEKRTRPCCLSSPRANSAALGPCRRASKPAAGCAAWRAPLQKRALKPNETRPVYALLSDRQQSRRAESCTTC
jgi:hypothetical protein